MKRRFLISHKHKIAFAMIPKTGITSIAKLILMEEHSNSKEEAEGVENVKDNDIWAYCRAPSIFNSIYSETCPESYKAICFVRNPFSRVYSSFKHFMRHGAKRWKLGKHKDFLSFVKYRVREINDWHFLPMSHFIKYVPSHTQVFRFEEYEKSFENIGIKIPHENRSNTVYEKEYNEESIKVIKDYYGWDLDNLDYSFSSYGDLLIAKELKKRI